ncbi:MAG: Asp-tRNA(Asn)/Glu-tRNA(Gln) amidotransferase subunit GatC [Candidatus Buchananbacteria bacterium]|nr:Asp-tRNA(Asn)/Glu-tRNA(Gln) amidotransferase subunit GatC [Candidatus Buchananbacteria bacterium]
MKLSKSEIEHIAKLARLNLSEDEAKLYSQQLSDILDYVEKLQAVDTSGVEETSQVTGLTNIMREDKIEESGISDELVASSFQNSNGYIKVPKIL